MARYNRKDATPKKEHVLLSSVKASRFTPTHEGAAGHARDARTELFLRATGSFAGQKSFYESADKRDMRLVELTEQIAVHEDGWLWLCGFLPWLRGEGNMRTAPMVIATEAVRARLDRNLPSPEFSHRKLLDSVMQRADEPGELLAYWHAVHGRKVPQAVKRAIADAATRLYTERSFLRNDSASKGIRFGDVLELTHPKAVGDIQGDLFRHVLDVRHGHESTPETLSRLRKVSARSNFSKYSAADKHRTARQWLEDPEDGIAGSFTNAMAGQWEWLMSALGDTTGAHRPLTKAEQWQLVLPHIGYMALLRNLRNLDEAGIPDAHAEVLAKRIADPNEVAKSRQLPFRFWSAYKHTTSLRWAHALETALRHSLANVPSLPGRTLILIDRSPSMFPGYGYSTANSSDIPLAEQAALFGTAVALRAEKPTLVEFGGKSREIGVPKGGSVMLLMKQYTQSSGTDIPKAVKEHYAGHDRVLIVTDEQTRPGRLPSNMEYYGGMRETSTDDLIPKNVPVYMWNLAGYTAGALPSGNNRYTLGGLQDSAFRMVTQLENVGRSTWPWETTGRA